MPVEAVLERLNNEAATAGSASAATNAAPPTAQEPKPEETKPAGEQPQNGEQPVSQVEDSEPDIESPSEASGDFEKFKPVFEKSPELKSELKQIIGREKAFSELTPNGSFMEMREILRKVPTLEDADALVEKAENATLFGEQFRGDPRTFVESLQDSDSLAFKQLATSLPEILAETEPQIYEEQARFYTNRVIGNVLSIAESSGDENFLNAARLISQYLGIQPGAASQPATRDNSEAARLRRQLRERDEADSRAEFDSFWGQTDSAIINTCIGEIEASAKKALPNATQAQLKRIIGESWDKTLDILNSQPQVQSQIDSYRSSAMKGRRGLSEHRAIVDFSTRRARLVIPKVVKEVISDFSKNVIQASNDATNKKKEIAQNTRDAGSGPQGTTSTAAPANQNNGQRRTMSSIFSDLEKGTYVKK